MASYSTYDFESDPAWRAILGRLEITGPNVDAILEKRKKKYFVAQVNPDWKDTNTSSNTNTNTNTNTNAASADNTNTNDTNANDNSSTQPPPQPSPSSSSSSSSSASSSSPSSPSLLSRVSSSLITQIHVFLHVLSLISCILYVFPFLGAGEQAASYYRLLYINIASGILHVLRKHGTHTS